MMELPPILTKTTAGLPNWAWGLAIIGGIAVGIYFNKSAGQSAAPTAPTDTSTPTDASQSPPDTSGSGSGTQPPGSLPPQPVSSHGVYTVKHGDTLASIAVVLGTSPDHLWQSNRYTICQCMKHLKIACSFRRGPMPPEIPSQALCVGMHLDY